MTTLKDAQRIVQRRLGSKQDAIQWKPATLGDGRGTVSTGNNMCYVRLSENSSVIEVLNLKCAPVDGLRVRIAKTPEMPLVWQVIGQDDQRADENGNSGGGVNYGGAGPHQATHGYLGSDQVNIDWRQITSLRVYATSTAFTIGVIAGLLPRTGADLVVPSQTLDLTSHIPAAGALYVLISIDSTGAIAATDGDAVASLLDLTLGDIPDTPVGNFRLAAVRLYASQTKINETRDNNDIRDLRWPQERLAGDVYAQFGVQDANEVLAGPASGADAVPTFRSLVVADMPATVAYKSEIDPNTSLFFTDEAIAADRYELSNIHVTDTLTLIQKEDVASGTLASFEIAASDIGADVIVDGLFRATYWAKKDWPSGVTAVLPNDGKTHILHSAYVDKIELIRKDAGATETVLSTAYTDGNPVSYLTDTLTRYTATIAIASADIVSTDTLIVRLTVDVSTEPSNVLEGWYDPDIFIGVYGTTFSRADFPLRGSGSIGGSGTTGRVAQFTGASTIGDSNLIGAGAGVLTLTSAGAYNLTVPETMISAGRNVANTFTVGPQTISTGADANIGVIVKGHSATQSGNLQEWQDSAAAVRSFVNSTGDLYINRATASVQLPALNVEKSYAAAQGGTQKSVIKMSSTHAAGSTQITTNQHGLLFDLIFTGSAGAAAGLSGITGSVYSDQTAGNISTLNGNQTALYLRSAGTATNMFGFVSYIALSGAGGATNAAFFKVSGNDISGAGGITNLYGLSVVNLGKAKVTNAYGVHIAAQSGSTINSAITTLGGSLNFTHNADSVLATFTGYTTLAAASPIIQATRNDTAAGVSTILGLTGLGSGANGDGVSLTFAAKSSTTAAQTQAQVSTLWIDATHASRKAALKLYAYDTAQRLGVTVQADGVAARTIINAAQEGAYATTAINLTLTSAHHWVKVTAAATVTLPTAVDITGREYIISATAAGVIVDGDGTETINGYASWTMSANSTMQVKSDGANWIII